MTKILCVTPLGMHTGASTHNVMRSAFHLLSALGTSEVETFGNREEPHRRKDIFLYRCDMEIYHCSVFKPYPGGVCVETVSQSSPSTDQPREL